MFVRLDHWKKWHILDPRMSYKMRGKQVYGTACGRWILDVATMEKKDAVPDEDTCLKCRGPPQAEARVRVAVKIPEKLHKQLVAMAEERGVSLKDLMIQILEEYDEKLKSEGHKGIRA